MRFLRNNGLSLFFLVLFLVALVAQAIAGHQLYNNEEIAHAKLLHQTPETLTLLRYVTSSSFGQAVMENWQSEFLAVGSMVIFSVYLRQRGSSQSKPVGAPHEATAEEG